MGEGRRERECGVAAAMDTGTEVRQAAGSGGDHHCYHLSDTAEAKVQQGGGGSSTAATTLATSTSLCPLPSPPLPTPTTGQTHTSLLLLSTKVIFFFVTGSMKGDTAFQVMLKREGAW